MIRRLIMDVGTVANSAAIGRLAVPPKAEDGFLAWPLHQIAAVSILTVTEDRGGPLAFAISSFSRQNLTESAIVASVEGMLAAGSGTLVTFNGRAFDLPVLQMRAAAHGIITRSLRAVTSTRGLRSPLIHVDVLDSLCPAGTARKVSLADVCDSVAIPSKSDASTAAVTARCEDKYARIQQYCELDVISTWLLDLTLNCHENGDLHRLQAGWSALSSWISSQRDQLEHLSAFVPVPRVGFPLADGAILGSGPTADPVF